MSDNNSLQNIECKWLVKFAIEIACVKNKIGCL